MKRIARRGDASVVFSDQLAEMKCHAAAESVGQTGGVHLILLQSADGFCFPAAE